ncbi:type I phosphomannose isomerase catalytic subunit [Olsenella sp. HMSC062G07]|uniref:type I phosphomannose isomerase catalytic subunit n=1 Tax=Olsenella sp. HMSC062G07 TaxID=1739330 RepID=UPI0008A461C0|nr:type I phosphomannose isomerase catalytic subunit [Olsenella sp. HMSC062G07]OFK24188.1 mannose-6-phosphate isomerase [Olsenella sp. HMSC062G07]
MNSELFGDNQERDPLRDLIFMEPVFHEKIWGGRRLETDFGYDLPAGPIGECWAISAHPHGDCQVKIGAFAGRLLSKLWDEHPELFGGTPEGQFPLLVKIIDANEDLSIQVHPDDVYAARHEGGSLGKMECWYVLHAEPGTTIVVGQRAVSREECARLMDEGRWGELVNELPVHAGDFFQIAPGTLHAIKGGTLILETQQSSDVTYRVYDYDRVQDDGTRRELHLSQALDVIDYALPPITSGTITRPELGGVTLLESCPRYKVWRVRVDGATAMLAPQRFYCASVIEGEGVASGHEVEKGDHFVVPAGHGSLQLEGHMQLIVSSVA